ncbi:hypothetical protein ACG3SL_06350 [Sphingomonas sp. CJ20]
MDLNYLLHRHQVSLMRSLAATGVEARSAHRGFVRGYAARIRAFQQDVGADASVMVA